MSLDAQSRRVHGAPPLTPPEDIELLVRAQAGDVAAFEGLVERHRGRVFGLAQRMLNSADDAAEVLQEAFLSAYRNLPHFRGDAQFGSWVYRIAANHALMRLRHRKVVNQVEAPLEGPQFNERGSLVEEVSDFRDAEGEAMDKELRQAIEDARPASATSTARSSCSRTSRACPTRRSPS